MNYVDTFIMVADDCRVSEGLVPPDKGPRKSIARIQYELLSTYPYQYTQEDLQFETFMRHKGSTAAERARDEAKVREAFFAKPQACLRSSPLPKTYGWGLHFDRRGCVAAYPVESVQYRQHAFARGVKVLKALRSSRTGTRPPRS